MGVTDPVPVRAMAFVLVESSQGGLTRRFLRVTSVHCVQRSSIRSPLPLRASAGRAQALPARIGVLALLGVPALSAGRRAGGPHRQPAERPVSWPVIGPRLVLRARSRSEDELCGHHAPAPGVTPGARITVPAPLGGPARRPGPAHKPGAELNGTDTPLLNPYHRYHPICLAAALTYLPSSARAGGESGKVNSGGFRVRPHPSQEWMVPPALFA